MRQTLHVFLAISSSLVIPTNSYSYATPLGCSHMGHQVRPTSDCHTALPFSSPVREPGGGLIGGSAGDTGKQSTGVGDGPSAGRFGRLLQRLLG